MTPVDQDAYGELDTSSGAPVVRFCRNLPHPPEKVWRALSEDEHLAAWFPTTIEGDRRAGAPLEFNFRDGEGPSFSGEMVTFDPPSLMALRWGGDLVEFHLAPDGAGTRLELRATMDELGKAARDGAGWHSCLDALALDAADTPDRDEIGRQWEEHYAYYCDAFGPEACTVGPPEDGHAKG
jgi:uncharacterized protein YndB with AHSA1/START domain